MSDQAADEAEAYLLATWFADELVDFLGDRLGEPLGHLRDRGEDERPARHALAVLLRDAADRLEQALP